jgi:hypothetical protein
LYLCDVVTSFFLLFDLTNNRITHRFVLVPLAVN